TGLARTDFDMGGKKGLAPDSVKLTIVNQTGKEAAIYWLNQGKSVSQGKLLPGKALTINSYFGHRFRAVIEGWENTPEFEVPRNAATWRLENPAAGKVPTDPLPIGTVWKGKRTYQKGGYAGVTVTYELHVSERDGTKFKGHVFDNGAGRNRAEVDGEINGESITWRERARGNELTMKGTYQGDTIRLTFHGLYANGVTNDGVGELKRE
ncbi:MAG TPA: hypothetical protein VNX28_19875, partial [Gemmataceae bacterium]|nr:hypothetical protein [Gemmataceae bacterium]